MPRAPLSRGGSSDVVGDWLVEPKTEHGRVVIHAAHTALDDGLATCELRGPRPRDDVRDGPKTLRWPPSEDLACDLHIHGVDDHQTVLQSFDALLERLEHLAATRRLLMP